MSFFKKKGFLSFLTFLFVFNFILAFVLNMHCSATNHLSNTSTLMIRNLSSAIFRTNSTLRSKCPAFYPFSMSQASSSSAFKSNVNDNFNSKADFFDDISDWILDNSPALHYGVCASDIDGDGKTEFFVCGFGYENKLLKWNGEKVVNIGRENNLHDTERRAIGVCASDIDKDGIEEIYVLNTDTFGGRKKFSDRLFDKKNSTFIDLFSLPKNMDDLNMFAGRSVCCVDRKGNGKYGFVVANYGGPFKLFEETEEGFISDNADVAKLKMYPIGGRSLLSFPLISHTAMDIFVGNEAGPNFLFVNKNDGSGEFVECASAYGLMDKNENCRGVSAVDVESNGELGIVYGNWEGPHRLFKKMGAGPIGSAKNLGFTDVEISEGGFVDVAPADMAEPTRIRTVITADFDNDGFEEIFFNNLGSRNKLFVQNGGGNWIEREIFSSSKENFFGTGGAIADIDEDGMLELLISHGEAAPQPLSLFKCKKNSNDWLRIQPLTQYGAPARGASISLKDKNGRWQKRVIDAGSGYLCCMEPVAHFGLGQHKDSVKVKIFWPDGSCVELDDVALNQTLRIPYPSKTAQS